MGLGGCSPAPNTGERGVGEPGSESSLGGGLAAGRTFVLQEVVGNEVQREAGLDPAGPGQPWQEFQMYCKGTEKPSAAC